MQSNAEAVVEAFYAAYAVADVRTALSYMTDDVRFAQHFDDVALPFTGETVGKDAIAQRLAMIQTSWTFLQYGPPRLVVEGEVVRGICPFLVQHRASGETFDGTFRHIWTVRDGRIASIDEYLDVERLRAFLRLLGVSA